MSNFPRGTHSCFESVRERFYKSNTKLVFAARLPSLDERLVIASAKVDTRKPGKPLVICASFCPFAGCIYRDL